MRMTETPDRYDTLASLTLEQLRSIRGDVAELRNDSRDVKAALTIIRAYIADQHTEQNLLNSRLASAELKIERLEQRLLLREE
jgi:ferritin